MTRRRVLRFSSVILASSLALPLVVSCGNPANSTAADPVELPPIIASLPEKPVPTSVSAGATARPTTKSSRVSMSHTKPQEHWVLTYSDDFDRPYSLSGWNFSSGGNGWGNQQLQWYDQQEAAVSPSGYLALTARRENNGEECWYGTCEYVSARMSTEGIFSQEYGKFEARIKLPAGSGLWPAFWLEGADMPQVGWPDCGEIDIIEKNGLHPNVVESFAHAADYNRAGYETLSEPLSTGYHTYSIDWTASGITWFIDGVQYFHVDRYADWPFDQPFFIILDLAVGGAWPGSPTSSTKFPASMQVDWVRVYKDIGPS